MFDKLVNRIPNSIKLSDGCDSYLYRMQDTQKYIDGFNSQFSRSHCDVTPLATSSDFKKSVTIVQSPTSMSPNKTSLHISSSRSINPCLQMFYRTEFLETRLLNADFLSESLNFIQIESSSEMTSADNRVLSNSYQ